MRTRPFSCVCTQVSFNFRITKANPIPNSLSFQFRYSQTSQLHLYQDNKGPRQNKRLFIDPQIRRPFSRAPFPNRHAGDTAPGTRRLLCNGLIAAGGVVGRAVREEVVDDEASNRKDEDQHAPEELGESRAVGLQNLDCREGLVSWEFLVGATHEGRWYRGSSLMEETY